VPNSLSPFYAGLSLILVSVAFGGGYFGPVVINPGADIGVRLAFTFAGYATPISWGYLIVYCIGAILGGILGSAIYKLILLNYWTYQNMKQTNMNENEQIDVTDDQPVEPLINI